LFHVFIAHIDDDRVTETSVHIRQAQGTFPSAFSAAIFHLVEMLEDEEIIENGAIGVLEEKCEGEIFSATLTCLISSSVE
jgi:hypothetical protein